ncbi:MULTISPECIES: helix-turn-helix domain-containing protein [unclassified Microbacterium]|uniref:helix-turn-helix domain-containing protein n=1 Tax=unclassified Microbacterium TaxID=2609290 RepID=UPI0020422795|nr:PucR family transcriptional regulator [Microbacterium sp. USTB-Y]MBS1901373.1 PucR family transcriptional regulator ligand-binding domain-containing protein [Actinomycetota bacterium]
MEQQPTLRTLLGRRDLHLRLVGDEAALPPGSLDRPLRWVHNSDLTDPTPFLAEDIALLTTGTQFGDDDEAGVGAYVHRLVDRGVVALGFGTEVHRSGIPAGLAAACAAWGLPLLEVPYGTPFIAVARAHAEAIAAQAYARRTWALETQRALSVAALRPHGLESTLTELSRRLGCWVGMYDAAGQLVHEHPADGSSPALDEAAADLLVRGGSANRVVQAGEAAHTLLTVGRAGHLRGVVAIASGTLDPETRGVVTSVIAMAGLSLEQSQQLERSRRRLHRQLLASLLADDPTLARRVLGALPPAPIVVAVAAGQRQSAVVEWWERQPADAPAAFLAESEEGLVMCLAVGDAGLLDEVAARTGVRIGASAPEEYTGFSRAHAQALTALRRSGDAGVARYADTAETSVLAAFATDEARLIAESLLAPLRQHDAQEGAELERSLRVWLEHDTRLEPAAAALGVHRHTLRTRIGQAAMILDADLTSFPARAELWAALRTAGDQ